MRRRWVVVPLVLALGAAVAGCSGDDDPAPPEPSTTGAVPRADLTFGVWGTEKEIAAYQGAVDTYNAYHDEATVTVKSYATHDDLDAALTPDGLPGAGPWRVHFHVQLHADPAPPLTSTRPVLRAVLTELFSGPVARTDHIEVETYTWGVLPAGQRPGTDTELADGIAAELDWVRRELLERGLVEVP